MNDTGGTPRTYPLGMCQCGCGRQTNISPQTAKKRGYEKGKPMLFLKGHYGKGWPRYVEEDRGFTTKCHIWQGSKTDKGYGSTRIPGTNKTEPAHRRAFRDKHGYVPTEGHLDHLCRVPACVNPEHLEPVSHAENCRRGLRAKLNMEKANEIRSRRNEDSKLLAKEYGVARSTIYKAWSETTWKTTEGK